MEISPRPYQREAIIAALKALRRFKRALVVMATGLGKTLTAAFIAKEYRAKRILFLVHNNFILKHAIEEFRQVFEGSVKMAVYNGLEKNGAQTANIVFATWQTMRGSLKKWSKRHFDLIIIDEAHHTEAETYRPIADYFTGSKLGITATPDREDKGEIREVFGAESVNITLEEAIARGWLPRIEYHVVTDESLDEDALQKIASEIRESKRRFTMAEVNRRIFIKKRDREIARIINGYNEKSIVFCSSIRHAERMSKWFDLGATFHCKTGKTQKQAWDKNQAVLRHLRDGIVRRVTAVNAFNEGVNVPSVGLVAFCRVTGVLSVFRQQLGRGLRPGKDKLIVLDFVGNFERVQLVIELMNRISDMHERFTSKEEMESEGYSRKRFEVSGKGFEFTFSDKVVDLMSVLEHCDRDFYPTMDEAAKAARSLGIKSKSQYQKVYRADKRLPSNPDSYYEGFDWYTFLGNEPAQKHYESCGEASRAAKALGIMTKNDYATKRSNDPRLPCNPSQSYGKSFPGWYEFLGKRQKKFYPSWKAASRAALNLGIKSQTEYNKKYSQDPRLPSSPSSAYSDFPNWKVFLGGEKKTFYPTLEQACVAARALRIKSIADYRNRYKSDKKLPSNPNLEYERWPGWNIFLGKS